MIVQIFGYKELQPYGSFQRLGYRWEKNGHDDVALVGESATLVGWIPFYQAPDQLPEGFLKGAWGMGVPSIPILLNSGNNAPPEKFDGPGGLKRFMGLHEFRAAVSLDVPTLWLNARGEPTSLEFLAMAQVGTTPFRAEHLISPKMWYTHHSGGDARAAGDISEQAGCITIRLFLRMRLGWLSRQVGKALEGDEPPWANMMIEYTFDFRDGFGRASFWGTAVPSQHHYSNWKKVSTYEIESQMSGAAYHGFVRAGGGMDALPERYSTVLRGLKAVPISSDHSKRNRFRSDEGIRGK
ncbi:MAG TPA: hypothetical protein VGL53_08010 [Bryobacteraceae bacterium]